MRTAFLCVFWAIGTLALGQKGLWQHLYGGSAYEELAEPLVLANGTLLAVGSSRSTDGDLAGRTALDFDGWLIKTNPHGRLLWQHRYGASGHDRLYGIAPLPTGGFVLAGSTESLEFSHGARDAYILVVDALGRVVWERAYGGSGNDAAYDVAVYPDGSLLIAAETGSRDGDVLFNRGGVDMWVLKLSSEGNVIWQRTFGGAGTDRGVAILPHPDGGCMVLGSTDSNPTELGPAKGGTDWVFQRLTSDGFPIWQVRYGGSQEDEPHALVAGPLGKYFAVGTSFSADGDVRGQRGDGDIWVVSIEENSGRLLWAETYGGESHDGGNAIAIGRNYELIVAGTSRSMKGQRSEWKGLFDGWLLRLDPRGKLLWQKSIGGFEQDTYLGTAFTREGDILLAGATRSTDKDLYLERSHGSHDAWLLAVRDPRNPGTALPKLPTLVSGYVTNAVTGEPLAADVRLLSRGNQVIEKTDTDPRTGLFQFATTDVGGISLGAVAEGYLFFSQALRLIPDEVGTEVRVDIALEPLEPGSRIVLNNVNFPQGDIELPPGAATELDRLALFLLKNPGVRIYIDAHTDSSATELANPQLAIGRANRVKGYLLQQGVNTVRMDTRVYGASRPLFPGHEPEALRLNRRVEIVIQE